MQSPTPICIYVTIIPILCSYGYNVCILHTLGHLPLQCSLTWFRSCEVLKRQEQSVDKRLFHMSVSPTRPPSREGIGARNMANVQLNFELWITNYELFYRICYRTCFLLIRLKCWILIFEQICFIGQSIYILQRPTDIYCDKEISALTFSTR